MLAMLRNSYEIMTFVRAHASYISGTAMRNTIVYIVANK